MELDTANGVPFIYHDPDTMMVYIAAKVRAFFFKAHVK